MQMEEKIYKSMGRSGALSIAVGVVAIVTGVADYYYGFSITPPAAL